MSSVYADFRAGSRGGAMITWVLIVGALAVLALVWTEVTK
jgi:hypothetical protein